MGHLAGLLAGSGGAEAGYRVVMKPEPRFAHPAKRSRPRGSRLIEYYSLKLGRRVTAWSHPQFEALLSVEVDSAVLAYCERPVHEGLAADLWARREGHESFAVITEGEIPKAWMDLPVTRVSAAELAAKRIWLRNWQTMLPAVIATRDIIQRNQRNEVLRRVREPLPLAAIERDLCVGEPTWLRGCIFHLLLEGALKAPELHEAPLSLSTRIGPAG